MIDTPLGPVGRSPSWTWLAWGALAYVVVAFVVGSALFLAGNGEDLQLRHSEVRYVLAGIDPYDVFMGHRPLVPSIGVPDAYPPWAYALGVLLFGPLSLATAKVVHVAVNAVALVVACRALVQLLGRTIPRPVAVAAFGAMLLGTAFLQLVETGNYQLYCLAAGLIFLVQYQRGHDGWAALALAVLQIKVNLGLFFFIPPLLDRRFRVLALAAAWLGGLTVLVSLQVGKSPGALLLELFAVRDRYVNLGTFGILAFVPVLGWLGPSQTGAVQLVAGVVFVALFSHRFRRSGWVRWLPAFAAPIAFLFNQAPSWVMVGPLAAAAVAACHQLGRRFLWPAVAMVLLVAWPRLYGLFNFPAYIAVHNVIRFGGWLLACGWLAIIAEQQLAARPAAAPPPPGS